MLNKEFQGFNYVYIFRILKSFLSEINLIDIMILNKSINL
jgi:hypothetical protein